MPRVPVAENTVGFAGGVSARVDAPNMGAGDEMIGRSVQGLGERISDAAETMQVVAAAQDNAATKEAANGVDARANDILFTGQNAYFVKRGKEALDARPDTEKQLDSIVTEARSSLQTPRQQELFDEKVREQRLNWGVEQRRLEAEQRRESAKRNPMQSVYRNIQDGVVVDPKDLANAITMPGRRR
jgi:hypothetical protein